MSIKYYAEVIPLILSMRLMGSCIDTVFYDGKILMQDKQVPGENEILESIGQ